MIHWSLCFLVEKMVRWSYFPDGVLKFYVDSVARGKPGPSEIGGAISNSREVPFKPV